MAGKYLLKDKKSNQWVARSGKNANDLFYYFTERRDEALHFSTTAEIEAEKARMKSLGFKTDVFDIVEESADYQKKRFKEPYYMYESVNQSKVNTADGLYDWMTEYMRKHGSNRFTSLQFILGNGNNIIIAWDMKSYKGIHEGSKDYTLTEFVYKFMDQIIKQSGISDIYEADMNTGRFKAVKEENQQKTTMAKLKKGDHFHLFPTAQTFYEVIDVDGTTVYARETTAKSGFDTFLRNSNSAWVVTESKKIVKEDAPQKIVIKNAWGVEVKDYKAGDPIPAGAKFKIFNAKDTDKIEAYADSLFESKKVVENKMVGIISLPVGSKFIDDSFGGKRTLEVVKHGDDDVVHVREVGTGRKFAYDASIPGGNKKVEKIEESIESQVPLWTLRKGQKFRVPYDTNIHKAGEQLFKITYVSDHQVDAIDDKGVPYTWENPAQTMVIKEGRIAKGYENLTADERAKHLLSHPTSKYMSDLKSENITERAIRKAVKEMLGKPDKDDPIFIQDVEEGCIKESSFYVKFSLDGKSSKYYTYANGKHGWTDNKSTATKFSTRDEAEASLKKNPFYDAFNMKFFDVVQEEGEAAAVATTTANVANPELPLKMEESYTVIFPTGAGQKLKTIEDVNKFVNGVLHMKDKNAKDVHLTDAMLDKWNKENDIPLVIVKEACSKKKKKVQESLSSKNHKFTPDELKVGKRVIDKIGGKEVHGKITVNHHDLYKDNPYTQDKRGSTVVTIVTDSGRSYDVDANDNGGEFILEDAENLENSFKYQTSVAGGMGSDAENAESAKEHEEETSLIESIIKKAVKKRLTESVGQKLNITLVRKPQNMKEVERDMRKGYGERVKAVVDKSYKLSENEYDKFVYNFMVHTTYLNGQGGVDPDGTVHVIEITAPARKTIYVDPEGYDYARYVGW